MNRQFWMWTAPFLMCGSVIAKDPEWFEAWNFKGDLRVRYEGIEFDRENVENRNRFRFRARLGAEREITDRLTVVLRFASGSGEPTSTNQTFDNSFSGKDIVIDRAYFTYDLRGWELGAGKHKNPFLSTDAVWDTDVNPEGFYQKFNKDAFFLTLGQSFVEENGGGPDTNLYAGQVGGRTGRLQAAAAYYHYTNLSFGPVRPRDFSFFDVFLSLAGKWGAHPVKLTTSYVNNTTGEIDGEDTAWAAYVAVGETKKAGDWAFLFKYAHIELFSVNGRFADSDFGFTDKEGFHGAAAYQANKYMSWRLGLWSVDSIVGNDLGFNRVQFDCALKF